ncbi:hypothetical protein [Thalassoroseus pseudoceratinae]|uniref:hypothetical protein n=1 Tax=Thalassoroseus pseudoceratinae TaxID=2713176 RepID=UPI00141E0D9F|nr:hypothetical protein [Thalassoroseus pseudoceratinae]
MKTVRPTLIVVLAFLGVYVGSYFAFTTPSKTFTFSFPGLPSVVVFRTASTEWLSEFYMPMAHLESWIIDKKVILTTDTF